MIADRRWGIIKRAVHCERETGKLTLTGGYAVLLLTERLLSRRLTSGSSKAAEVARQVSIDMKEHGTISDMGCRVSAVQDGLSYVIDLSSTETVYHELLHPPNMSYYMRLT